MNNIAEYFSKITAEERLKERTKDFVKNALKNKTERQTKLKPAPQNLYRKKLIVTMASAAACLALFIGGYFYYKTPVNYVSLDINPSIELGINAFDMVVSTKSCNEDGELLLKENSFNNKTLNNAISLLVAEAVSQGFVFDDGSTVIALTAESDSDVTAAALQASGEEGITSALKACAAAAVVYSDCSDLQLRTEAKEFGLSPGKYRLIKILQTLDNTIKLEQYKNARITDIIVKINELASSAKLNGLQNGELVRKIEMIKEAANKMYGCAESGQNTQNQQGSQSMGQGLEAQNQNQYQGAGTTGSGQNGQSQESQQSEQNQNQNAGLNSGPEQEREQNQNQSSGGNAPKNSGGQNSGTQSSSAESSGYTSTNTVDGQNGKGPG